MIYAYYYDTIFQYIDINYNYVYIYNNIYIKTIKFYFYSLILFFHLIAWRLLLPSCSLSLLHCVAFPFHLHCIQCNTTKRNTVFYFVMSFLSFHFNLFFKYFCFCFLYTICSFCPYILSII